ncbi:MAG: Phage protein gp10 family [Bradyrhizobium sp.]|nr:Phage protein gp10 family [Bradyrhizobium sp.]
MPKNFDCSEFKARLAKLPDAIRRADSAALAQNAAEWVGLAKTFVPEDKGKLAASITHHATDTGGQIVQAGGETTSRPIRKGAPVTIDYSDEQEFGNKEQQAHPFFWTAYRTLKRKMKARRSRAMSKALKEI